MTGILELSVLVLAIIAAIILYKVLKTAKRMLVNTVVGVVLLVVANLALGLDIAYSWVVILICAIGGAVGAVLVIVCHCGGIAF